ncbi:MAG: hypothetical protein WDW38_006001 [Sanguina aurantia]
MGRGHNLMRILQGCCAQRQALSSLQDRYNNASGELKHTQASLQARAQQLDSMRGLYLELRDGMASMAGMVGQQQAQGSAMLMEALGDHNTLHRGLVAEAVACAASAQASSQHSASQSGALLAQQRALVHELATAHEATEMAHGSLNEAEVERRFLGRQVLAASVLARLEDRKHQHGMELLLKELPHLVMGKVQQPLQQISKQGEALAGSLDLANAQLTHIAACPVYLTAPNATFTYVQSSFGKTQSIDAHLASPVVVDAPQTLTFTVNCAEFGRIYDNVPQTATRTISPSSAHEYPLAFYPAAAVNPLPL